MPANLIQTAESLNISTATLKNWLKSGLLASLEPKDVKKLQKKISSGKVDKLKRGANKTYSNVLHSHNELLVNKSNAPLLSALIFEYQGQPKEFVLALYINQLVYKNLLKFKNGKFIFSNNNLKAEVTEWKVNLNSKLFVQTFQRLQKFNLDWHDNILSFTYQTLSLVGKKQQMGAYYTSKNVIRRILASVDEPIDIVDPCCGSGNFLVEIYQHFEKLKCDNPGRYIRGYDIDDFAILIARANMTLVSDGKMDVIAAIIQKNSLIESRIKSKIKENDVAHIMTNPPWGAQFSEKELRSMQNKFNLLHTRDSFAFFLAAQLKKLKKQGVLSFVLPISFMNVRKHAEIRKHILTNYKLISIELLSQKFSGVMTESILIQIINEKPNSSHLIKINSDKSFFIKNSDVLKTPDYILGANFDSDVTDVLKKIELHSPTNLKGKASWALGLVTGNNNKFLRSKPGANGIAVIRGRDVLKFKINLGRSYLVKPLTELQQCAPASKFNFPEKLVYRFIGKELIFAVDKTSNFTLNSANVLVPESTEYSCDFLCALFNSQFAQFYFQKKFNSLKVLKSHLEVFPLPAFDQHKFAAIEEKSKVLQKKFSIKLFEQVNEDILSLYSLDSASLIQIRKQTISKTFLP